MAQRLENSPEPVLSSTYPLSKQMIPTVLYIYKIHHDLKKECNRDWLSDAKHYDLVTGTPVRKWKGPRPSAQQPALSLVHLIYGTYPIGGDHTAYTPTALLHGAASHLVVLQKRHRHLSG
eukprot:scaffold28235_cov104-Skeletonema_marinoi.AAC.2